MTRKYSKIRENLKLIRHSSVHIIPKTDDKFSNRSFVPKDVDDFIDAIQEILNTISSRFDRSTTQWDYLKENAIRDTNFLLENLYRGEKQRKKEIKEKWGY